MTNHTLQISIPTYNRPEQLEYNLSSIFNALQKIQLEDRKRVGICIYNNSTKNNHSYHKISSKFNLRFKEIGLSSFNHVHTGFNIGGTNNCAISLLQSKAEYTWFLPDDDLAAADSIKIILEVIKDYSPSMIHGGFHSKTILSYNQTQPAKDSTGNSVYKVHYDKLDKENAILDSELIQAQEHVYKTSAYNNFIFNDDYIKCLDDMMPGLFSLICIKNNGPLVLLDQSIGLFRDGDPKSGWRHSWSKIALNQWPDMVANYVKAGLLEESNVSKAKKIYTKLLYELSRRPDILLGLNLNSGLNPYKTFKNFGLSYLHTIILSPVSILKKIIQKPKIK